MKLNVNLNELTKLRTTQIRMLDALHKICKEHGLTYWIDFGTLLGAVRQKGFIPWDDDLDVSMPIKDYKKFLKIAETELPEDIFLQTPKTDKNYKQCFTKLCDKNSTFLHDNETGEEPYHQGIYLDIFPSVVYPKMPAKLRKVLLYFTVRSRATAVFARKNVFFNYCIYFFCKFIWLLFSPFKSDRVAQTVEDNGYYFNIPKAYLYPLVDIEFAGKLYPGPNNTHEYLSMMYGKNYIALPPVEKRVSRAEKILFDTPCKYQRQLNQNNK